MKWTAAQIEIVRAMARTGATIGETAASLSVSKNTISGLAFRNHIRFGLARRWRRVPFPNTGQLLSASDRLDRDRWQTELLPELRARVRAEVEQIMKEGA